MHRHQGDCPEPHLLCVECSRELAGDNQHDMCDDCYNFWHGSPAGDAYDRQRDEWERARE